MESEGTGSDNPKIVHNQLLTLNGLLSLRIDLQRALFTANELKWDGQATGPDDSLARAVRKQSLEFAKSLQRLQNNLSYHFKSFGENDDDGANNDDDDDDEEITSDESDPDAETENDDDSAGTQSVTKVLTRRERDKRMKRLRKFREKVLRKWHDKVQVTQITKKNANEPANPSVLEQIDYLLATNRSKLIEKIHTKRMEYAGDGGVSSQETYDPEIYDDIDFYYEILRQNIHTSSDNLKDPIAISKQWAHLDSLRTKLVKRKTDSKASKHRRIRYDVIAKAVGVISPEDQSFFGHGTGTSQNDSTTNLLAQNFFAY